MLPFLTWGLRGFGNGTPFGWGGRRPHLLQGKKVDGFALLHEGLVVRERGLEPPPLAGPDPKSGVSAISPLAQTGAHITVG